MFGLAEPNDPYVAKVEIWIDGELDHVAALPMRNTDRKVEPADVYKRQDLEISHQTGYLKRISQVRPINIPPNI